MKLKNIFKKKTQSTSVSAKAQKLEKNQLSQINGGGDSTVVNETDAKYTTGGGRQQGILPPSK